MKHNVQSDSSEWIQHSEHNSEFIVIVVDLFSRDLLVNHNPGAFISTLNKSFCAMNNAAAHDPLWMRFFVLWTLLIQRIPLNDRHSEHHCLIALSDFLITAKHCEWASFRANSDHQNAGRTFFIQSKFALFHFHSWEKSLIQSRSHLQCVCNSARVSRERPPSNVGKTLMSCFGVAPGDLVGHHKIIRKV